MNRRSIVERSVRRSGSASSYRRAGIQGECVDDVAVSVDRLDTHPAARDRCEKEVQFFFAHCGEITRSNGSGSGAAAGHNVYNTPLRSRPFVVVIVPGEYDVGPSCYQNGFQYRPQFDIRTVGAG